MPSFSAIVTSHNRLPDLFNIIGILNSQTKKPNEILVLLSGYNQTQIDNLSNIKGITIIEDEDKKDFGNNKRKLGVQMATGDWLGFFNDDDEYSNDYVEKMMSHTEGHNFVYCNFRSHLYGGNIVNSEIKHAKITSGSFIVKTEFAKRVGYNHSHYQADWEFVNDLQKDGLAPFHVQEVLYDHR